ncbi:hypothetical protein H0486_15045 [Lachnospiraceae bacterium MD1]|uniref:Uncharacterized protein n=1 Tax=Variimorphobacter saccharofermentans TaxID=2755051 RepID=A0A839K2X6_9FIRM|nr:hypothetical protein [Variimorphobacter saccharofermentans]MBB2184194.1 hypothetical protein [Variimorphobacter saccharofermentans]
MDNFISKINEIQNLIKNTAFLFYQQKNEMGYAQLGETLEALIVGVNELINYEKNEEDIEKKEKRINLVLSEAMKAIEVNDTILLSDILLFDLSDLIKDL